VSTQEHEEAFSCESRLQFSVAPNLDGPWTVALERHRIQQALCDAVAAQEHSVTISIPAIHSEPTVLMASRGFEELTGYHVDEVLGKPYRFLSNDCTNHPVDLRGLRLGLATGASTKTLLMNRRKSGELFVNLLHIQAMSVAQRIDTGEALWYLIGVQLDVTRFYIEGESFNSTLHRVPQTCVDVALSAVGQVTTTFQSILRFNALHGESYEIFESTCSHG